MTEATDRVEEVRQRRFRPYPEYRDSGVEWLGKMPAHWEAKPAKAALIRNDSGVWGDDFDDDGTVVLRSTEQTMQGGWRIEKPARRRLSTREATYARLCVGDLLVTKSSGSAHHIGKTSIVDEQVAALNCCYSNFMQRLRVSGKHVSQFYWYFMNCPVAREQLVFLSSTTTGLGNLNGSILGAIQTPMAPPAEQRAIASFLDRETAKIDALVARKERLIELLQEKRTGLITRAVTRGLDPNVPMKDSGVEWLGDIPAHWRVGKLKHACERIFVGIAEAATFAYVDEGVPMLRSTDVRANRVRTEDIRCIDIAFADRLASKQLRTDDIMTVRTGNAGVSAVVPPAYDGGQCFTLVVSRPTTVNDSRYFCYWLNARPGQEQFRVEGLGTAQVNISVPIVQNAVVCIPPREEQVQIANWIEQEVTRWNRLMDRISRAIDHLREFRTALISAAVTGKIDVREAMPR